MRVILVIVFIYSILLSPEILAQHQKAQKLVKKGNKLYNKYRFDKALQLYYKALELDSNNAEANLYVGIELLEGDHKWKGLSYLQKAAFINPEVSGQLDFYLGMGYQYNNEFILALEHFEKAQKNPKKYKKREWKELLQRIDQCRMGVELVNSVVKYEVENMGPEVNSQFRDYAPLIVPGEDKMVFASNRKEAKNKRDGDYFLDIYMADKAGSDSSWTTPGKVEKLNTRYDDMGLSFDHEGKKLLLYHNQNNGDIYITENKNGDWSKPESLGPAINTPEYMEASACLSPDGNTIYFSSNRKGGKGGMDLYFSKRDDFGDWRKAQIMSTNINTSGNEEAPQISADGSVLFFSSDGHPGIGGYDIFYSVLDKKTGAWGDPQNMGLPVNSPQDDINFVLSQDGLYGYYSAIRSDTHGGEDIYKVKMRQYNHNGDNHNPSLLASLNISGPNAVTGNDDSREINLDSRELFASGFSSTADYFRTGRGRKDFEDIVLRNVYFDIQSNTIDPSMAENLHDVAKFMRNNRYMQLVVAGHTDNTGSERFNSELSKERAEEVFQYLVNIGVAPSRMSIKAYGKTKPLATNDDEREGRELNRRVEFHLYTSDEQNINSGNTYANNGMSIK